MESHLFLLDLLRDHEPKSAAKADALQTLRAAPRHVRGREAPGVRGFIPAFRGRFMRSRDAGRTGAHGDREPLRSAGFSPPGRPLTGVASCGLKSALPGKFMGRAGPAVVLIDREGIPPSEVANTKPNQGCIQDRGRSAAAARACAPWRSQNSTRAPLACAATLERSDCGRFAPSAASLRKVPRAGNRHGRDAATVRPGGTVSLFIQQESVAISASGW